jgi:hypothetical protein
MKPNATVSLFTSGWKPVDRTIPGTRLFNGANYAAEIVHSTLGGCEMERHVHVVPEGVS